ncbi:hypothetical protein N7517_008348 [Penicillium concentricum]|uniref:Major facilitator superfamily (MFS) profile domain-containing protein n=1 Tax=Penicillium concentricum TaxID=293559 RepID=A0A9W9RSI8_9EURO|nr:uncharacterized protein N7517_008348 [Penicillium concentricum]KAJ5365462.1 hypothetical protein N7517_008348 [Penicillium concentricum]
MASLTSPTHMEMEHVEVPPDDKDTNHGSGELDEAGSLVEKRLLRRIDAVMMPMLVFGYLLQYMDKVSLANASIMGVIPSLHLHGQQFSWLSGIFYFGYLAASYPVSVILVRFPLGKTLAISTIFWGVVLICHSATFSFAGMMVVRTLLGVLESPIGPGFTLITSIWYRPSEHAARHGLWYAGNSLGAMTGTLVAYGCAHIQNGPLAPWRWLFIVLGSITILWGIVLVFRLPDSPFKASFLSPADRIAVNERAQAQQKTTKTNEWSLTQFLEALKDPKTWFLFLIEATATLVNGIISNFTSLILSTFGFTQLTTLLLNLPIYAFQLFIILSSTALAHRLRRSRLIICMAGNLIAIVGVLLIRQIPFTNKAGRLVGLMLLFASSNNFPLFLSLISSNVGGFTKRATSNAVFFIAYCAGNIAGPQLYIASEEPVYQTAFTSMLIIFIVDIVLLVLFRLYLNYENKKRNLEQGFEIDPEAPSVENFTTSMGRTPSEVEEREDQTDWENRTFRYIL